MTVPKPVAQETSDKILGSLNYTRIEICPTYEWCAISIEMGVSENMLALLLVRIPRRFGY
jgi:hypothetical protein